MYIFMMVFGMTRPRGELTTYRARGGHATNPTRYMICISIFKCLNLRISRPTYYIRRKYLLE